LTILIVYLFVIAHIELFFIQPILAFVPIFLIFCIFIYLIYEDERYTKDHRLTLFGSQLRTRSLKKTISKILVSQQNRIAIENIQQPNDEEVSFSKFSSKKVNQDKIVSIDSTDIGQYYANANIDSDKDVILTMDLEHWGRDNLQSIVEKKKKVLPLLNLQNVINSSKYKMSVSNSNHVLKNKNINHSIKVEKSNKWRDSSTKKKD
jgi:hypothetical protein